MAGPDMEMSYPQVPALAEISRASTCEDYGSRSPGGRMRSLLMQGDLAIRWAVRAGFGS